LKRGRSRKFGSIAKVATRKLAQLDAAETFEFLRSPPGNHLEELKGDRAGQYSIRIKINRAFAFVGPRLDPQTLRSSISIEEATSHGI
jgi:toxin HigB-1